MLFTARIGRAALFDASLFGLALRGVCLAAGVTTERRCALTATVSPITRNRDARKHHDPLAGLFSVALVVIQQERSAIKAACCSLNAQPLAGSLPCSVRTFLSCDPLRNRSSNRPTCSLARLADYSNHCSTRTALKLTADEHG